MDSSHQQERKPIEAPPISHYLNNEDLPQILIMSMAAVEKHRFWTTIYGPRLKNLEILNCLVSGRDSLT